jgi:hypothetical protein
MVMTVHNRYSDIELVSPVYFCNGGIYYEYPVRKTYASAVMKIGFSFDPDQDEFRGILMYEMRRKGNTRSNHQSSTDTIYTKVIEEASKMMRLLVTWKIERSGEHKVNIILAEYDSMFAISKDKLAYLYDKINDQFARRYSSLVYTWLMYDNTMWVVTYEIVQKAAFELKMTISEGAGNQVTLRPICIEPER